MAVLLITHDLGIVAGRADRVAVMYAGQIVEEATTADLFARPSHPYTQGLFASVPRITGPVQRLTPIRGTVPPPTAWPEGCRFRPTLPAGLREERASSRAAARWDRTIACAAGWQEGKLSVTPLLEVRNLVKHYTAGGLFARGAPAVRAVDGVSFDVGRGETLALVGESGCGKSSVGRTVLRLQEPTAGEASFEGIDVFGLDRTALRRLRRRMQIIFQDPLRQPQSPDDRRRRDSRRDRDPSPGDGPRGGPPVGALLEEVGLDPGYGRRYPHRFSAGRGSASGIARALRWSQLHRL